MEELKKEEFVIIVDKLRDSSDLVDKVNELFCNSRENVECDFCNGAGLQISHEKIVIFLLKKLLNDVNGWIEYFIFELDYGRKFKMGMARDDMGDNIDLSTAEKLYDYLMHNENGFKTLKQF